VICQFGVSHVTRT